MRRLRKWILTVSLALIAFEALYLIAANVFLRTSIFDQVLNGNRDSISVRADSAYSVIPGWVQVRQVQIRGQDTDVQWLIQVDDAQLWVAIPDLILRRSFHVTHLNAGSGLFQIRTRSLTPRQIAPASEELRELAPIPGFAAETLLQANADADKRADIARDKLNPPPAVPTGLRQVHIEDIHIAGFRQIWIGGYRFDGKIDVSGNFTLNLERQLVIPHGRLEILSGNLVRLDRPVLQKLQGVIDANIRDFQLKKDHGLEIFKTIGAQVALQGALESFDPLSYILKTQDWFKLKQTHGTFAVDVRIRDGRVVEVPLAQLIAEPFLASFSHFLVDGAARVGFKVTPQGLGVFDFQLPQYRLLSEKDRSTILEGKRLSIALESPDLDIAHLYRRVTAKLDLPDARIAGFGFINHWIPPASGIEIKQGSGNISAAFAVANDSKAKLAPGWLVVNVDRARVRRGKHDLIGRVRVFTRVEQVFHESDVKELKVSGSEVQVFGSLPDGSRAWETRLKVVEGYVRPDEDPTISARIAFHMPDVTPFLSEFGIQSGLAKVGQNLLMSGSFEASTELRLGEHRIELDKIELRSERSQVFGFVHLTDEVKEGGALIHYWPFHIGIGIKNDDTEIHILGADDWYKALTQGDSQNKPLTMN